MHLLIKPESISIETLYTNHSTYYEGDSGLDLFFRRSEYTCWRN